MDFSPMTPETWNRLSGEVCLVQSVPALGNKNIRNDLPGQAKCLFSPASCFYSGPPSASWKPTSKRERHNSIIAPPQFVFRGILLLNLEVAHIVVLTISSFSEINATGKNLFMGSNVVSTFQEAGDIVMSMLASGSTKH